MISIGIAYQVEGLCLPLCVPTLKIAFQQFPPYIETVNNETHGILFDVFKAGILSCCQKAEEKPI